MRRFFFAACIAASAAKAQQPVPAVQPVVDMVLAGEAELASAIADRSVERLQRLSWSNRKAAFELVKRDPPISPGDPAAVALRAAHVACANAHSSIGMLAGNAVQVLITNVGGDNTKVDNDANRQGLDFFLKPFFEQRQRCAERSGLSLPASLLRPATGELLPSFAMAKTPQLVPADRTELSGRFSRLSDAERAAAQAVATEDVEVLQRAMIATVAFRRFLHAKDDPDMPRRDYAVFKECRWAAGHAHQVLNEIHEGLIRPDIRKSQLDQARKTLEQYRDSKADCAGMLGLPRAAAAINPALEAELGR